MFDVKLLGLVKLEASFDRLPVTLQDRLRIFMARFTLMVRDQVRANIVERFHLDSPEFPEAVQTMQSEVSGSIEGRIFIDTLPYAAIQEYGGQTSPHTITPSSANVLAFLAPGMQGFSGGPKANGLVFAMQVNHPGSNIPERSYMRRALVQMRQPFEAGIREVVAQAAGDVTASTYREDLIR